jgi:hypothetical protein
MKKTLRIRFALVAAFAIAFAQLAVAAQPWPIVPQRSAPAGVPDHCAGLAHDDGDTPAGAPTPNTCEVHCQDAAQPDAMPVALATPVPDAWLPLPLAKAVGERSAPDDTIGAKCASPPARLLFARFLI